MAPTYINKLQNQRVLVIGGSTGIGFAVAVGAVEYGAHVVLSSSNQTKLDSAVNRLKAHVQENGLPQCEISGKTADLASPDTVDGNIKSLLEFATRQGKIDHVVFTAGDALNLVPVSEVTVQDIPKVGAVRMTATLILAKYLPAYINQSVNSSVTLTGGTMSTRPSPGWSVLIGTAGGVEVLARGLAIDLKPVRVNCAVPGAIHTELFRTIPEAALAGVLETMRKDTVTGTVGKPEEMAEAYLYFMKSTFTTGSSVIVDGGRVIGDSKGADIHV